MTIPGFIENVGYIPVFATSAANPQLQFFENFPGHLGATMVGISFNTLSVHAVNIPLSISFNQLVVYHSHTNATAVRSASFSFGLYSLNVSTLSLANSASTSSAYSSQTANQWMSMATSATQNITPGTWYFAINCNNSGDAGGFNLWCNSSLNVGNAIPGGFLMGRVTASTNGMPASIATSDLDITGSDAIRQPYIILTA